MEISEIFNTPAIALYRTETASNREPFLLESYFPNRKKMSDDIDFFKIHKGLSEALKRSNYDALPEVRPRGQVRAVKERMPLFRESMVVKESDAAAVLRAMDSNDPFLQPIIDSIYNDVDTLLEGAEVSAEWLRSQLFAPIDGEMKISLPSVDNMISTYDYDSDKSWKNNNYLEITGASDKWDQPTAKPLNDIRQAIQHLASSGITATTIIGNSTTFDYLLENDQIKSAIPTILGQTFNFVDESTIEEVLRRRLGVEWIPYNKMFTDYNGTQRKFYPDDYVTILGNGTLGNTWRGATPEELTAIEFMGAPQAPADITVLDSGVAVAIQTKYEPARKVITTASQIVLPSFEGMDSIFVIKVK